MAERKKKNEGKKTFCDRTMQSWFLSEPGKITVGASFADLMGGKGESIEIKEIFYGDNTSSWQIVIDKADQLHLLKTSSSPRF
jgi:hypothetical protein